MYTQVLKMSKTRHKFLQQMLIEKYIGKQDNGRNNTNQAILSYYLYCPLKKAIADTDNNIKDQKRYKI